MECLGGFGFSRKFKAWRGFGATKMIETNRVIVFNLLFNWTKNSVQLLLLRTRYKPNGN